MELLVLPAVLGVLLIAWGLYLLFRRSKVVAGNGFYSDYPRLRVTINNYAVRAVVADTVARRVQGLSGLAKMDEDQGMLLKFSVPGRNSIWMKDMEFPLDLVWLRKGRAVDISENVPVPALDTSVMNIPKVRPRTAADSVLEVNAGLSESCGWKIGDEVRVEKTQDGSLL